jgi:hypothetical protein
MGASAARLRHGIIITLSAMRPTNASAIITAMATEFIRCSLGGPVIQGHHKEAAAE